MLVAFVFGFVECDWQWWIEKNHHWYNKVIKWGITPKSKRRNKNE